MSDTFVSRLFKAPKSFAVASIAALGTSSWWYPLLEAASNGAFGEDGKKWALLVLSILGVIGWAIPQRSISGTQRS